MLRTRWFVPTTGSQDFSRRRGPLGDLRCGRPPECDCSRIDVEDQEYAAWSAVQPMRLQGAFITTYYWNTVHVGTLQGTTMTCFGD
jgi:hypothetical protein